jgi:hypothetical protein
MSLLTPSNIMTTDEMWSFDQADEPMDLQMQDNSEVTSINHDRDSDMDMDMGHETVSTSELHSDTDTSDDICTNESEKECHGDDAAVFEPPIFPDELRVNDEVPVINASRFRKAAYK